MRKNRGGTGAENRQAIYIDTNVYLSYVFKHEDTSRPSREVINKISNSVKMNPDIVVKLPAIILAEVHYNILKNINQLNQSLDYYWDFDGVLRKLNVVFEKPNYSIFQVALNIREVDDRIEPSDALAIAHALCDSHSVYFITFDSDILRSSRIRELEEKMRNKGKRAKRLKFSAEYG